MGGSHCAQCREGSWVEEHQRGGRLPGALAHEEAAGVPAKMAEMAEDFEDGNQGTALRGPVSSWWGLI